MRRRAVSSSIALANQMVQVSTEAKTSPIITALTTMSAAMNMPQGDRSRGSLSTASGTGVCAKAKAGSSRPAASEAANKGSLLQ